MWEKYDKIRILRAQFSLLIRFMIFGGLFLANHDDVQRSRALISNGLNQHNEKFVEATFTVFSIVYYILQVSRFLLFIASIFRPGVIKYFLYIE